MGKMYSHDMSEESEKVLLPEGWRDFEIIKCEEQVSKSNNPMFKFTFVDCKTQNEMDIYAIAVKKKRWFLKSILKACSVPAAADGVYNWDREDVLDKIVKGRVEHQVNKWINRDNVEVETIQHKIVEIKGINE